MIDPWKKIPLVLLFALAAYLSLFQGSFDRIADDPGLGWHLANGKFIAETGEIPREDPFLAPPRVTNPYAPVDMPRPWINEQWLGDLILFRILSFGGWPLVYGVCAALYLIAYFGIAADSLRRSGEGGLIVLLGVLLAFKLGQVHLIVRPVLLSIFFFAIVVARSRALVTRAELPWSVVAREAIILGALIAVWANIHPAFIYGFVVLGIAVLSLVIGGGSERLRGVRVLVILFVCLVASALNPFGFHLYESIANLGGSAALRGITTEWSPVDLVAQRVRSFSRLF